MVLYYIEGQQVGRQKAISYYITGLARNGLEFSTNEEAQKQWQNKSKSEEAREYIFNMSAIQEQGGLEIIIETN